MLKYIIAILMTCSLCNAHEQNETFISYVWFENEVCYIQIGTHIYICENLVHWDKCDCHLMFD